MRVSNLSLLAVCVLMCACARTSIESSIVFAEGSDSCHFYRIPAMTLDSQGNVVAVIDRRYESLADLGYRTTSIDIACKRSTDGGRTWSSQKSIARGDTSRVLGFGYGDASLTTLPDGRLLSSSRRWNFGPRGLNTAVKGTDGIWHWEGERFTEGLLANPCNGDIVAWNGRRCVSGRSRCGDLLLHSYIKDEKTRRGLTLAVSSDNGTSWKDVLTLQEGPAAYSTMVVFRNGDVGVLYEDGSRSSDEGYDIVFSRIPRRLLRKITSSKDS